MAADDYLYFVLIDPNKQSSHSFSEYTDREGNLCSILGPWSQREGRAMPRRFKWSFNQRKYKVHKNDTNTIDFIKGYPMTLGSPNAPENPPHGYFVIAEVNDMQTAVTALEGDKLLHKAMSLAFALEDDPTHLKSIARLLGSNKDDEKMMLFDITQYARNEPAKFIKLVEAPDTEYRSLIKQAIDKQIISKRGIMFYFGDQLIGNSEEKAIRSLMDDKELYANIVQRIAVNESPTPTNKAEKIKGKLAGSFDDDIK
jgi:hypothetical protein